MRCLATLALVGLLCVPAAAGPVATAASVLRANEPVSCVRGPRGCVVYEDGAVTVTSEGPCARGGGAADRITVVALPLADFGYVEVDIGLRPMNVY